MTFLRNALAWPRVTACLAASVVLAGLVPLGTDAGAAAKPRFRLSLDATSLSVARGSSSSVTVLVTRVGSFTGPIKLTSSTRKGLKMVFDENPLVGDDTDLEATADGTAKVGTTTLTISGSDGRTTVRVRLRVKVTAGSPAALATVAPSTAAATTLAATTSPATTVVTTATTTTTSTTSTTSTTLPTTTAPAAPVGDLIITRKVSQTPIPCAPAVTGNLNVSVTISNSDSTPRAVSLVNPGSCIEVKWIELSPGGGGTAPSIAVGTVLIVRSVNTAGSPIRRVLTVVAAGTVNVGSSANVVVKCTGAVLSNGQLVPLTDGQQFVFNNIPAGASCTITDQFDATPPRAFSDNVGLASDATVVVPGRPAACAIATITTPVPAPAGCYAEFVHLR